MKTKINGIETNSDMTVLEFVELQRKKGKFEETAQGFTTNIQKEAERIQTAQELLDEAGIESPISSPENTKPITSYHSTHFINAHEIPRSERISNWIKQVWGRR